MFFYFFIVVSLASILKEGFHIKRCVEPIKDFKKLVKESYQTTTKVQNSNLTKKKIPKSSFFKICWFFSEKPRIFFLLFLFLSFWQNFTPKTKKMQLGFLPNFGNMLKTIVVNNRVIFSFINLGRFTQHKMVIYVYYNFQILEGPVEVVIVHSKFQKLLLISFSFWFFFFFVSIFSLFYISSHIFFIINIFYHYVYILKFNI